MLATLLRWVAVAAIAILAMPATASAMAPRRHIPLMIQTTPATPGVRFALGGRTFVSDRHGLALITVSRPGSYRLEILERAVGGGDRLAMFAGWSDGRATRTRAIRIKTFTHLEAGFEIRYRVRPRFTNIGGTPVPTGIESVVLRSDDGDRLTLTGGGPYWIEGIKAVSTPTGLEPKRISYVVERVIAGSHEWFSIEERPLTPSERDSWRVRVRPAAVVTPVSGAAENTSDPRPPLWALGAVLAGAAVVAVAIMLGRGSKGRHSATAATMTEREDKLEKTGSSRSEVDDLKAARSEVERLIGQLESDRRALAGDLRRRSSAR